MQAFPEPLMHWHASVSQMNLLGKPIFMEGLRVLEFPGLDFGK